MVMGDRTGLSNLTSRGALVFVQVEKVDLGELGWHSTYLVLAREHYYHKVRTT